MSDVVYQMSNVWCLMRYVRRLMSDVLCLVVCQMSDFRCVMWYIRHQMSDFLCLMQYVRPPPG